MEQKQTVKLHPVFMEKEKAKVKGESSKSSKSQATWVSERCLCAKRCVASLSFTPNKTLSGAATMKMIGWLCGLSVSYFFRSAPRLG